MVNRVEGMMQVRPKKSRTCTLWITPSHNPVPQPRTVPVVHCTVWIMDSSLGTSDKGGTRNLTFATCQKYTPGFTVEIPGSNRSLS